MDSEQSEKIKIYIVIGLFILAVVVAYFRFFHAKTKSGVKPKPAAAFTSPFPIPTAAVNKASAKPIKLQRPVQLPAKTRIRDLFSPPQPPSAPGKPQGQELAESDLPLQAPVMPSPPLKLIGTLVEAEKPMAIINDQLVRPGDQIGGYEVIKIDKRSVLLRVTAQPHLEKVLDFSD